MKFKKIELHAFRAYKDKEDGTFDFTLPEDEVANFVSIYAPNGFGKTSFYDGVEWGMTNSILRLEAQSELAKVERGAVEQSQGTRQKQYILKNKYADEQENGYVSLYTTIQDEPFIKYIPDPNRAGSTDYQFDRSPIHNKYFRDVLLSQEGIDSFLKETNPHVRYEKFLDHFGDEKVSRYYEYLDRLQKKNDKEISALQNKIDELTKLTSEPVDEAVFHNVNQKIQELRELGEESFSAIDDQFDKTKKLQLDDMIDLRSINMTDIIQEYEKQKKLLFDLQSRKSDYFIKKQEYLNNQGEIESLQIFLKQMEELKLYQQNTQALKDEVANLYYLRDNYSSYKRFSETIIQNNANIAVNNEKVVETTNELQSLNTEYKLIVVRHEEKNRSLQQLRSEINNASILFELLKKKSDAIDEVKKEFKNKNDEKVRLENNISDLLVLESKLSSTIESAKFNIYLDIRDQDKYKSLIEKVEVLIENIQKKKDELVTLEKEAIHFKQLHTDLQKLLQLGTTFINENHLSNCPLCSRQYESNEELYDRILLNPLLDEVRKKSLIDKKEIETSIASLQKEMDSYQNKILDSLNFELNTFKDQIKNSDYRYRQAKIDISKLEDCLKGLELECNHLQVQSNHLSLDEYKNQREKVLATCTNELEDIKQRISDMGKSIEGKNSDLSALNIRLQQLKDDIKQIQNNELFQKYHEFNHSLTAIDNVFKRITEKIQSVETDISNEIARNNELQLKVKKSFENMPQSSIKDLQEKLTQLYELSKNILKGIDLFERICKTEFKCSTFNEHSLKEQLDNELTRIDQALIYNKRIIEGLKILMSYGENLLRLIERKSIEREKRGLESELSLKNQVKESVCHEKRDVEETITTEVQAFFHESLINDIYKKIDPHPDYKNVSFTCKFEKGKGELHVFVDNDDNMPISPTLYYSTAQLNVLCLSIFLAKALHAKDDDDNDIDAIFIDDPIQAMDSINILSTIDLLRSLIVNHGKQIILSTHDENFHLLLQKKIPETLFGSKFIQLETFGKVAQ